MCSTQGSALPNQLYGRVVSRPIKPERIYRFLPFRAQGFPWIRRSYEGMARARLSAVEWLRIMRLRVPVRRTGEPGNSPRLVVSLTSFPARIGDAWIPIETILRQDEPPDRVVLVLSDEEFPDRKLPLKIRQQQRRGLEILWTPRNTRSYNKLLPTRLAYPDSTIITIDDDVIYVPWLVSGLTTCALEYPNAIIGYRGWELQPEGNGLAPYETWVPASLETPRDWAFLTGVGGVLYPPGVLPVELLTDIDLALKLCPTADDVWFWAVARTAGIPALCLGLTSFRELRRQKGTPALQSLNRGDGQNDVQLSRAIEHFGFELA